MNEQDVDPVPLESILCTEELDRRPSRTADHEKDSRALLTLTEALADSPDTILQTLADTILDILRCGSAGVSLLTTHDGGKRFYWPAIAGVWKPHIGGGTPRDFGPCGNVLDLNRPLLMTHVERRYTYFAPVTPAVEEALLVPFYLAGKAVGTIWAVAHDKGRRFDSEDLRQLVNLSRFASVAYRAVTTLNATAQIAAIVESSDDAIISKNLDGIILSWNGSAERLFGYKGEEAIGRHITLIIPPSRREEETTIIEKLRRGERIDHFETIRMRKDGTLLDVSLTISPLKDSTGRVVGASKVAHDITAHNEAEKNREQIQISSRLLQVQDAERRRIARELHDGIGQLLAAINMNISKGLREEINLSPAGIQHFGEASNLIEQAAAEIRTVSYLLHPPLLDEMGLQSALRVYIGGFAERSKIAAKLEVPVEFDRLPHEHELCLFRIAQECLTNIHRHSESPTAVVRLLRDAESIEMEVIDEGRGIDQKDLASDTSGGSTGVGLRGMRERVKQFGGNLEIRSRGRGTSIVATLPLTDEVLSTANNEANNSKTELPATRTQTA